MKKYKLILFLSTAFLSVACTDSFFDLEPSSSVPTDKVYKTADDFNVAVMGCYSKLQTQVSYFTECCEYRSDNLTLSAPTAGRRTVMISISLQIKLLMESWKMLGRILIMECIVVILY